MGLGFACTTMNLQIVLNTQKNSRLKIYQATQKNPGIKNFKLKKILWSSLSREIQSTSPGHLVYNDPPLQAWTRNPSSKEKRTEKWECIFFIVFDSI